MSDAGEANDAVLACTQDKMKNAPRLLKLRDTERSTIWIRLPSNRRPAIWDKVVDPVVLLESSLYGQPLGG